MVDVNGNDSGNCNSYNNTIKYINMNTIKFLKQDRIELNGVTYKPYTVCSIPQNFGCIEFNEKEGISEWFNYKGYTYIIEK